MTTTYLLKHLRPIPHFKVTRINGPNLYYGSKVYEFLNFGSDIARTGSIQGLLVVQTVIGDTFIVIPTGKKKLPWVFSKVDWH